MKRFYVYGLFDPRSNELRYIGETYKPKDRLIKHLAPSKLKSPTHKNNWVKSLLSLGIKPSMSVLEEFDTEAEAFEAERFYIAQFRNLGIDLTNATDGGEGGFTGYPSEETLVKIKLVNSQPKSEEHKRKISASHIGVRPSPITLSKLSYAKIGSKNGAAKLDDLKVRDIKLLLNDNVFTINEIAKMYGVNRKTISAIKHDKAWAHITI